MGIHQRSSNSNISLGTLRTILREISKETGYNWEVWLSYDEEGNEFLPMSANEEDSVGIDTVNKRIILFPSHP